jgi:hypothetical protein
MLEKVHWLVSFQGRRKLLKLGGAGFEGHFPNRKGHLKIFPAKVGYHIFS